MYFFSVFWFSELSFSSWISWFQNLEIFPPFSPNSCDEIIWWFWVTIVTVIFTCRYFKLSWNTSALRQSNGRNFSGSSIREVIQLCLEEGIILGIAEGKVKERLLRGNELTLENMLSLHARFVMSKLRMWASSLTYTFRRAFLEETLSCGEVSETGKSHRQVEFICFSPSLRRKRGNTARLSLSLSFTSYLVMFAW